ncbi:thiamine kinase-like enzyme [Oikeobacillus pervagus]|uniref:Thiamine kinase-like enzyme n=1 Tax=Oikeobacillus pervagus TaxID=1325931 RepID=A0AAJ1WJQ1_9BACI|nr:phosphotransferase family protein [Oikeobacillus pervagus]MDQ0215743.1 thiamine kinase-like enzyme [Oikeobacillus pervagus]
MEHLLGQDWEIVSAGGATGEAFLASHNGQKLFLKRNSSPFLAVLSAERIVPKLIWTKRLENGDVITAQQWLNGRELKPVEMMSEQVVKVLKKIHSSKPLLMMLKRLGKRHNQPEMMLKKITMNLDDEILQYPGVKESIQFLQYELKNIYCEELVVCHGDVNHNNWLQTDNQLYLIDWDNAMIGDPAIDIGSLLYWYIPKENWEQWLGLYGVTLTSHLKLRMKWYITVQTLYFVQWHRDKNRFDEMMNWLHFLQSIQ